jgi:hypothetical protein
LNSENAVKLLLSDVYSIYAKPAQQDAFFAQAAAAVFSTLTTGGVDVDKIVPALNRAIEDNRLMAWSAHEGEQTLIAGTHIAGILPTDNKEATQIGVFFGEASASKMSYYMRTAVDLTDNSCAVSASPTFSAAVTLDTGISLADYRRLPSYVRSQTYVTTPLKTRTLVWVYGPPGGSFADFSWDGRGVGTTLEATGSDLGRPVAHFIVDLRPGERTTVTANFTAPTGEYGPLEARVTPMVNPATLSVAGC